MMNFIQTEQANCDVCESVIPTRNIEAKIDEATGIQTVKAMCPHCRRLYRLKRQLSGGVWQIVGDGIEVLNHQERARFEQHLAKRAGDVQLATA